MEQEFIFETLLFYKNLPCYYKIYCSEGTYYGIPTPHHYYAKVDFPHFIVIHQSGNWTVSGITESNMMSQIQNEMKFQLRTVEK